MFWLVSMLLFLVILVWDIMLLIGECIWVNVKLSLVVVSLVCRVSNCVLCCFSVDLWDLVCLVEIVLCLVKCFVCFVLFFVCLSVVFVFLICVFKLLIRVVKGWVLRVKSKLFFLMLLFFLKLILLIIFEICGIRVIFCGVFKCVV